MTGPLVTVGVPVYRGHDVVATTLECIRSQTYPNLDVLISVDGPDDAVVEACRPFLFDPRFRLEVQQARLGWAGNTDWTMRNRRGDFYIFQQHDDQVSPTYIADLVAAATRWPRAAICYAAMEFSGRENLMIRHRPNFDPDPIARALTHMECLDSGPLRGLIRGSALASTFGLQINEFESYGSEHPFMVQLALAGEFRFVEGPTYYKRLHPKNMHLKWFDWPQQKKCAAWSVLAAWMVEAIVPRGPSPQARRRLLDVVLERFLIVRDRPARWDRWVMDRLRGWHVDRKRLMFCRIDRRDHQGRTALLRAIIARLRNGGRFDAPGCLEASWEAVEDAALRRFAAV